MKKKLEKTSKSVPSPTRATKQSTRLPTHKRAEPADLRSLIAGVRDLIRSARRAAASTVNTLQVMTNFEIGRRIVEHEQQGQERAGYGRELLKSLSAELTAEFGKGFSRTNLENMRRFYLTWRDRVAENSQQAVGKLPADGVTAVSPNQTPTTSVQNPQQAIEKFRSAFSLSWTHYLVLLTIKDPDERRFYEIEAAAEGWSVPELKRQLASSLFERLALSRDKSAVRNLATEGQVIERPRGPSQGAVRPRIPRPRRADHLHGVGPGRGHHRPAGALPPGAGHFLFESRQHRFTFDEDHFFVDLVFYNRLLRCYVLIDLKLDKLTHQDLGQMQMYVNWFDRHRKLPDENPTVGILLCKRKKDAIVELTLPPDANIHAKEYKLYLPSKELLRKKLIEWGGENEALA